jgi:hypothetical protein
MQQFIPEMTAKYRSILERTIKSAAACGYKHPFKALSAVAQHWAYHLPELFLSIYDELPEAEPETVLFELAQLAKVAAKAARAVDSARTSGYLGRAIALYRQAGTGGEPSRVRDAAEASILLSDGVHAGQWLDEVAVSARDRFCHYRRSQAYGLVPDVHAAMSEIDAAIAAGPDDQYAPSFFAETGKPEARYRRLRLGT